MHEQLLDLFEKSLILFSNVERDSFKNYFPRLFQVLPHNLCRINHMHRINTWHQLYGTWNKKVMQFSIAAFYDEQWSALLTKYALSTV